MEKKSWNEYSLEEKSELLHHWWHYYGKILYTLDEFEVFNELVKKDSNKVWVLAVGCYAMGVSSQPLLKAMRNDSVNEFLGSLPELETIDDCEYFDTEKEFMNILLQSYNNPQPSIPMDSEVVAQQISDIIKNKRK